MNTQKGFVSILIILLGLVVIGGGVYFYTQNNTKDNTENTQDFVMSGIWKFEEVSKEPSLSGVSSPVWEYILSIDTEDETKGTLHIDGYQTITRLNVRIEKLNDSANIILDSYGIGNQFETYKKGDVLITVSPVSDRNLMSIDWYKMQPNIEGSRTSAIFVRQEETSVSKKVKNDLEKNITNKIPSTDTRLKFENSDYSFTYDSNDDCIKVNSEYLNKEGKEGVWLCPGANISAMVSGTPDEAIDRMIYPGGPDSDGIWGKACFYDEKRTTPNGYTVRYFEDPDVSKLWGSGNCGTHPTKQSAESVGNMNIYFVLSSKDNKYVLIEDINNSTSTDKVWGIINSFRFK